ncbi:MAG: DeoR/GlpR transcriptional regulator [Bryobacterales bacterium]|nr:DeoR/GlpR transcriptional regulator [Bryobacterales bacterium]
MPSGATGWGEWGMSIRKPNRLLAEERRREILGVLGQNGRITVEEVVRRFGVSAVTARGDLDALSESGALVRSHGGGVRPLTAAPEHPLLVRAGMHRPEKVRIARAALKLIQPLQTVILCTGSTSAELASQLGQQPVENITVITYALNVATKLAENPALSLVMVGGVLRQPSTAFVGPQAEQMMHSLHADHCFMSTVGLDVNVGLTTLDIMEAQLNRCMIQSAAQVTVLADSSKFGHRSLSLICDLQSVHRVITDPGAPPQQVEKLRARGIEVILA